MTSNFRYNFMMAGILTAISFVLFSDTIEAQEGYGRVHRATRRRTAIVVSSATHEKDEEAAQQQQAKDTTKSTQTTQTQQQTNTQQNTASNTQATTQTTTSQQSDKPLPIGTIVSTLPQGCESQSADNVEYYHCGKNYYRTAFQGNNLVYVTTDPPK